MTITSEDGRFEWDSNKDEWNIKRHGFSFSEILDVFNDPYFIERYDTSHLVDEDRHYIVDNADPKNIIVVVVWYTDRGNKKRLVSARLASKSEEDLYYAYARTNK